MVEENLMLNIDFTGNYDSKVKKKVTYDDRRRKQKVLKRQKRAANRQSVAAANVAKSHTSETASTAKAKAISNDNILIDDVRTTGKGDGGEHSIKKQLERTGTNVSSKFEPRSSKKQSESVGKSVSSNVHKTVEMPVEDVNTVAKRTVQKRKSIGNVMGNVPNLKFNASSKTSHGKVSSLFYHNPEIPNVTVPKVETVKEDVFAEESFDDLKLHPFMVKNLKEKLSITKVTRVQQKTIPLILNGQDVLVKSQTGSGKTLAYAIPIVQQLQAMEPHISRTDGPYVFIIVPTRELAIQSFDSFTKLVNPFSWVVPGCIMGGERKKSEKARLRKGVNILIATPGRLLDHLKHTESLKLSHVKWLVIDEADRLLDLGYEKDVTEILSVLSTKCPQRKQTILLSATLTTGVERLAGMTLSKPTHVDVVTSALMSRDTFDSQSDAVDINQKFATPEGLQHYFVIVPVKLRLVCLAAFLLWKCRYDPKHRKVIVFLPTQDSVDFHYDLFQHTICGRDAGDGDADRSMSLFKLHGNMLQKDRTQVFRDFCQLDSAALLCTDVAARGLDMPAIQWIVQYTAPTAPMDYIHRVGRTARIGHRGSALLFIAPSEVGYLQIVSELNVSLKELKVDDVLKILTLFVQDEYEGQKKWAPNTVQECASLVHGRFEEFVLAESAMNASARKAYQSFIRAYSSYPSGLKHIFHAKSLHLGHVAKSFALQETPQEISGVISRDLGEQRMQFKQRMQLKRQQEGEARMAVKSSNEGVRQTMLSEYDSGLSGPAAKRSKTR